MRGFGQIVQKLLFAACFAIAAMAPMIGAAADAGAAVLQSATFRILSSDGAKQLGRAHYRISEYEGKTVLNGRSSYHDGEYDYEHAVVVPEGRGGTPKLVSFEHSFFDVDGSLKLSGSADLSTGKAVCISGKSAHETRLERHIHFPPNTYAGATSIIPIEHGLKEGHQQISFHVFDCGPEPSVVSVVARPDSNKQIWRFYPGDLMQVNVTADVGWLGKLIDGLLPRRLVWFDPGAGWRYVGGRIQRYFATGPQVLLVREPSTAQAPPAGRAR